MSSRKDLQSVSCKLLSAFFLKYLLKLSVIALRLVKKASSQINR